MGRMAKKTKPSLYVIGSLRNANIPKIANYLREGGYDVFDNWYAAGERADDAWKDYERGRGNDYAKALANHSAQHVYSFDRFHLNRAHAAVLVLPAGRSGHLEAGWASASKPVFMLLDTDGEPERLDVMTQFLEGVYANQGELAEALSEYNWPKLPEIPFATVGDVQWLSGLWEGDGTFCISGPTPRMVLQMTDKDVVERAASIIGSKVWQTSVTKRHKKVWVCGSAGLKAVELMRIVKPYMGKRRQQQIVDTVTAWLTKRKYNGGDQAFWVRAFQLET